jgi:hypothetical protein
MLRGKAIGEGGKEQEEGEGKGDVAKLPKYYFMSAVLPELKPCKIYFMYVKPKGFLKRL